MKRTEARPPVGIVWQVTAAAVCRLFLNTSRRFVYPFAPALGRGLEVSLPAVTSLIAVNQITSMLSLVFGPLADRLGHRRLFLSGLAALAAGMLLAFWVPVYAAVLVGLILAGLGKSMFDPAILAFVGERVSYRRRALAVGALEVSWAGAALVGLPLIGLLISRFGWRAPFLALGIAAVLGWVALLVLLPARTPEETARTAPVGFRDAFGRICRSPTALRTLGFTLLFNGASDVFFVVYGVWLEGTFDLNVAALGAAVTVIGAAELIGEAACAALADRIGLARSLVGGVILTGSCYLLLPFIGNTLPGALVGVFAIFVCFEMSIVVALSFFTEVLPGARATMMSGYFGAASLGRVIGAMIGGVVWTAGGIGAVCAVSGVMTGAALLLLLWGLMGRETPGRRSRETA